MLSHLLQLVGIRSVDRRLHDLLRLYWGGQRIPVAPARLFAALKTLKSRSLMHP